MYLSNPPNSSAARNPLTEIDVYEKIKLVRALVGADLKAIGKMLIPQSSGRDIVVVSPRFLPNKKGLSSAEGQARLLHDLAAIELQAMELALRGVIEFPEAPEDFRSQLFDLALSEAEHLELCLHSLNGLGYKWGDWPIHNVLWESVRKSDELLDRILLVHCYLEGSGLDAGDTLLRRLYGLTHGITFFAVKKIVKEEVDHVQFGLSWFKKICQNDGLDCEVEFQKRFERIKYQIPKRIEPFSYPLRRKSGFLESQMQVLEEYRNDTIKNLSQDNVQDNCKQKSISDIAACSYPYLKDIL